MREVKILTPEEAAPYLGISAQAVRVQMRRGKLPIGKVYEPEKGTRLKYIIYEHLLEAFIDGEEKKIE